MQEQSRTAGKQQFTNARTLWVHWGRTGGGPRFLLELVQGDLEHHSAAQTLISFNPDAEIASQLESLPIPQFRVSTYNSKVGVIFGLFRLVVNSLRMRAWIKRYKVTRVVGVMESVYQSLAVPLLLPSHVEYVACIHDGRHHPGETSFVQRLGRRLELWRAQRVATFSKEVAGIVAEQTQAPVLEGEHPPFGATSATTVARTAPTRPMVFGLFGRLQEYKGVDVLLDAARQLRQDPSLPAFEVRIIGNGPASRYRDTDDGEEATWDVRWIPEEEVDALVAGLDVMILPYTEASQSGPVSLAMANGLPCIVTPVGALPSQVDGFGLVAASATGKDLAAEMRHLLERPELYAELSHAAVQRVQESLSWSNLAELIRGASPNTTSHHRLHQE